MPAAVDAECYPSLEAAIVHVVACGGGVVRTELAGTMFGEALVQQRGKGIVKLEPVSDGGCDG